MKRISRLYNRIMQSEVFLLNGKPIDLPQAIIALTNAVHSYDGEIDWYLGEGTEAPLGDLIVGAYWALTEWHAGQSSDSYAALCALGQVFSPGCNSGPEPDSGEAAAYELVCQWFEIR